MPTYILLSSWTQKGIENVKDSPNRLDKAREGFSALGVEIKEFWFCQGRYDMVVMIEAPDIQTYAKALLKLGSYGNIHAETLRALPENEYREIIAAIP